MHPVLFSKIMYNGKILLQDNGNDSVCDEYEMGQHHANVCLDKTCTRRRHGIGTIVYDL